jgi:hypothetical protein
MSEAHIWSIVAKWKDVKNSNTHHKNPALAVTQSHQARV